MPPQIDDIPTQPKASKPTKQRDRLGSDPQKKIPDNLRRLIDNPRRISFLAKIQELVYLCQVGFKSNASTEQRQRDMSKRARSVYDHENSMQNEAREGSGSNQHTHQNQKAKSISGSVCNQCGLQREIIRKSKNHPASGLSTQSPAGTDFGSMLDGMVADFSILDESSQIDIMSEVIAAQELMDVQSETTEQSEIQNPALS